MPLSVGRYRLVRSDAPDGMAPWVPVALVDELMERFCAICERKLTKKDSEHVCRVCFHAAREPKEVLMSDKAATNLAYAYGISQLINFGIQKLVEYCEKPRPQVDDKTFDCPLV